MTWERPGKVEAKIHFKDRTYFVVNLINNAQILMIFFTGIHYGNDNYDS
jgi:hypothetical protein